MDNQQRIKDKMREKRIAQRKKSKITSGSSSQKSAPSGSFPFRTDRRKDKKIPNRR